MGSGLAPLPLRQQNVSAGTTEISPHRYARFGAFDLDLEKQELFQNGSRVRLQGKVSQALLTLLEKPGEIVTREELRVRLWPADGRINYDANVNTTVNKLRLVLGDSTEQPVYVETVPRVGYSFIAKVEYRHQPPAREIAAAGMAEVSGTASKSATGPRGWKAVLARIAGSQTWFTIGVVALVLAGMLLGSAIVILAGRAG